MSTEQLERTYSDGRMDLTKLRRKPIITFNGEVVKSVSLHFAALDDDSQDQNVKGCEDRAHFDITTIEMIQSQLSKPTSVLCAVHHWHSAECAEGAGADNKPEGGADY